MAYEVHNFQSGAKLYAAQLNEMDAAIAAQTVIPTPAGFKWKDHPLEGHLFRTENGIECDFDVASLRPTGKTYWVDPNGNDNNSGEDADHPLQLIKTAINKADAAVVMLKNGVYNVYRLPGTVSKSIALVAAEGATPVLSTGTGAYTITKTSGYNYVYQAAVSSNAVYDVLSTAYKRVFSIEAVEAEQSTFCVADGVTYFHVYNNGNAENSRIKFSPNGTNFQATATGDMTIYVEGVTFVGGGYGVFRVTGNGVTKPNVYMKNCKIFGSLANSAVYLEGCNSILQNCEAASATDDGFGYHAKGAEPTAIEINCHGHHNGVEGGTDNGSTMHDGGSIIRVNGEYHHNLGPNVADVHATTASWNLGCKAYKSAAQTQDTQHSDFCCADNTSNMWLDTCSAYGSKYGLLANSKGGVWEKNCAFASRQIGADSEYGTY